MAAGTSAVESPRIIKNPGVAAAGHYEMLERIRLDDLRKQELRGIAGLPEGTPLMVSAKNRLFLRDNKVVEGAGVLAVHYWWGENWSNHAEEIVNGHARRLSEEVIIHSGAEAIRGGWAQGREIVDLSHVIIEQTVEIVPDAPRGEIVPDETRGEIVQFPMPDRLRKSA